MTNEIDKLLEDYNPGHDHVQLQYFVVGQGITDYGKYVQAQAELWSRTREIKRLKRALIATQIKLDDLHFKDADPRLKALDKEALEDELVDCRKALDRLEHEVAVILPLARQYAKSIEGKDRSKLIEEYQFERLKKQLLINTVFRGGNLSGVIDTILTMPEETQHRFLEEYKKMNIGLIGDVKQWELEAGKQSNDEEK